MNWKYIKHSIEEELLNRNLADSKVRLSALNSIESLMDEKFIKSPIQLLSINKKELKSILSQRKKLNGAETSIINHIYDILSGNPIPRRTSSKL